MANQAGALWRGRALSVCWTILLLIPGRADVATAERRSLQFTAARGPACPTSCSPTVTSAFPARQFLSKSALDGSVTSVDDCKSFCEGEFGFVFGPLEMQEQYCACISATCNNQGSIAIAPYTVYAGQLCSDSGSLSAGAIAGIVVAVLVAVAGIVLGILWFTGVLCGKRSVSEQPSKGTDQREPAQDDNLEGQSTPHTDEELSC